MALHSRPRRVAEEFRSALADIVQNEMKDPRITESNALVTVTHVDVSKDLDHATAFISVLGSEEQTAGVLAALNHSRGYIKMLIGERVRLKYQPDLHFKLDMAGRHAARINEVLKQIEREQPARPADDAPAS